jgi:hypothetical protein
MVAQKLGNDLGVAVGALHSQRQRLQRPADHPARMRIELSAHRAPQQSDGLQQSLGPQGRARDQVRMTTYILRQGIDRDVRAGGEGTLKDRTEQGVVANDDGATLLPRCHFIRDAPRQLDVDQGVEWIGWRFDHDNRYLPRRLRHGCGRAHRRLVGAIGEADRLDIVSRQRPRQECLRSSIERLRVKDHIARPGEGENRRRDRRHARRKEYARFSAFVGRQPILHDLAVRVIEPRIDQAASRSLRRLLAAGGVVEEIAALLGGAKHERRGQEHRRLDRTLGEQRIVTVAQHQCLRMQDMICQPMLMIAVFLHGGLRCGVGSRLLVTKPDFEAKARAESRSFDGPGLGGSNRAGKARDRCRTGDAASASRSTFNL